MSSGPLSGVRVIEFAGIGPAPFCAMLLSDMGAEVLRIDRSGVGATAHEVPSRGRKSLALDLKSAASTELCLKAIEKADVLIEGFRPGVMERLGLGPDPALKRNPRLIYGRMTGWGQSGPLAYCAGHDINYIALTGALAAFGSSDRPPSPPLNLLGDYGGGALYLAFGIAAALFETQRSGLGQVIDAAIVDGTASLMAIFTWLKTDGVLDMRREYNGMAGAAPHYRCYECAEGRHIAVGPIEPQFYALLLDKIGISADGLPSQYDLGRWPAAAEILARAFKTRTRDEWCELLEGTDVCFAPVLSLDEAPYHPHLRAREVFVERFGVTQPAPAPRFSRTPGAIQGPPPGAGEGGAELLRNWGVIQ